jgi:hypothetical protein
MIVFLIGVFYGALAMVVFQPLAVEVSSSLAVWRSDRRRHRQLELDFPSARARRRA